MPCFEHHSKKCCLGPSRRSGYYTSYYDTDYPIIRSRPLFIEEPVRVIRPVYYRRPSDESDDEYARRKDSKYARSADDLKDLKKQRDAVKEWLEGARKYEDRKHWKKEYEELKDKVKWMERKVDEERRAVLRRYRL